MAKDSIRDSNTCDVDNFSFYAVHFPFLFRPDTPAAVLPACGVDGIGGSRSTCTSPGLEALAFNVFPWSSPGRPINRRLI